MRSRVCVLSCLLWGAASESERFPLSGVAANGVNVCVTGKLMGSGSTMLEFQTPGRETAFRFEPMAAARKVKRTTDKDNTIDQQWGGWPFNDDGNMDLDFLKTENKWLVSVNKVRAPWFDFAIPATTKMTHLNISGVSDAQVILTRPGCTMACDADECMNGAENVCEVDANEADASQCFSVRPGQECKPEQNTEGIGNTFHCCQGFPLGVDSSDLKIDASWVIVDQNSELVKAACKAFGDAGAECADVTGKVGLVTGIDTDNKSISVWVPAIVGPDTTKTVKISPLVVSIHTPTAKVYQLTAQQKDSIQLDKKSYLIQEGPEEMKGKFVYLLWHTPTGDENKPYQNGGAQWQRHTEFLWSKLTECHLLVVDVYVEPSYKGFSCNSWTKNSKGEPWNARRARFSTKEKKTCSKFEEDDLCTFYGEETDAFRNWFGDDDTFADRKDSYAGTQANEACCQCGGGNYGGVLGDPPVPNGFLVLDPDRTLVY